MAEDYNSDVTTTFNLKVSGKPSLANPIVNIVKTEEFSDTTIDISNVFC